MTDDDNTMHSRVSKLEEHVIGLNQGSPGLLLRVDRLEWFVKALIGLATLGVGWKALDVVGQLLARQVTPP